MFQKNLLNCVFRSAQCSSKDFRKVLASNFSITTRLSAETDSKQPKLFKIYTKTGDKGKSSLFTGERRLKDDTIFEALGNTDELNSALGLTREFCNETTNEELKGIEEKLIKIQCTLLDIGSHIATPRSKAAQKQLERLSFFDKNLTKELEDWIDDYEAKLPILKNFILPSGGKSACTLHLSRSICRRLERSIQNQLQANDLDPSVGAYVNRLSDFLFVAARYASKVEGKIETPYKKP